MSADELTRWLNRARAGDAVAGNAAFDAVYQPLKRIALHCLAGAPQQTLSATVLAHEAYVRFVRGGCDAVNDRQHFFNLIGRAMRQILVDHARARAAEKRGGDWRRTDLPDIVPQQGTPLVDLLAIDQALNHLDMLDPSLAEVVEQYFFAGLTFEEIAAARGVSDRSVRRDWDTARAVLMRQLG